MKIKLKHTRLQMIFEVLAVLILIGMFVMLFIRWNELPEKIPGHYNIAGEVDRWGNKNELIVVPIMSIFLYFLLTGVTLFPSIWNMPVAVTKENKDRVYGCVKNMMILLKVEIMALFCWISYNSMEAKALSTLFLPILLITMFGTIAFFLTRTVQLSKIK